MPAASLALKWRIDRATYRSGLIALALVAVALVTRAGRLGDPAIHMDEQFYLLVADRMWHGALPYVDIWDRKPILLFLIYAALRPFSPDGIVAYQVGALLFATATAFVIVVIAQRFANPSGALLAGMAYLLYLPVLNGGGGQAPVFYNLLMAVGALEAIRAGEARDPGGVWRHGLRGMLWTGLAIQVKYTAAIEGVAFGLWLIALLMQRRYPVAMIARWSASWAAAAIAPTLLAAGFYALIGHGRDFMQANFLSIFERHEPSGFSSLIYLLPTERKLLPLALFAILSGLKLARSEAYEAPRTFLAIWTAFAMLGFFAVGNFYDHYALPLLVPATIVCAPLLGTKQGWAAATAVVGWFAASTVSLPWDSVRQADQQRIAAMVEAAGPYASHGCIYVNDGPTIVYLLTHSCLPSRYAFPSHLTDAAEAEATDAAGNMATLLATRPAAIFVADKPTSQPSNPVTAAMLEGVLARDYQHVATLPDLFPERQQLLYVRNDLLPQPSSPPGVPPG